MEGQGAMTITTIEETSACPVRAGRDSAVSVLLPRSSRGSRWRLSALSLALSAAPLALGSPRAMRAMTLVNVGVMVATLRQAMRAEAWERG